MQPPGWWRAGRNRWRRRARLETRINRAYPRLGSAPRHARDVAAWQARLAAHPDAGPASASSCRFFAPAPNGWPRPSPRSVRKIHPRWELLIADDASGSRRRSMPILTRAADAMIRVSASRRLGVPAAGSAPRAMRRWHTPRTSTWPSSIMMTVLAPHALAALACALAESSCRPILAFSDEDQLVDGRRAAPYFKPGWNPDLMCLAERGLSSGRLPTRSLVAKRV